MKKTLFIAIIFLTQLSFSQVHVGEQNINELDIKYIQLVGKNTALLDTKFKVFVDYGQEGKYMKSGVIKNSKGEIQKFNSMMDALNYMNKNGWIYSNSNEVLVGRFTYSYYLLEKK